MKELVFGTGNPAKLRQMRDVLDGLVTVVSPTDYAVSIDVDEDGVTAEENARKKAMAYAGVLHRPVLAMDNALYIDGLMDSDQPGVHVRRIQGRTDRPTDAELIDYYTGLVQSLGGEATGYWRYGLVLADSSGLIVAQTVIDSPRRFVAVPSSMRVDGYPLESIQIDIESGRYFAELNKEEQSELWRKYIGGPVREFIANQIVGESK